jgi:cysteine dioxygenase
MRDPIPSSTDLPIRGLTGLSEALKFAPVLCQSEIQRILQDLMIDPSDEDVQALLHYDPQSYTRNFVLNTPDIQVLVLCWAPGQASKIHDHGLSNCGLRVLSGRATETVYQGTLDECVPTERIPLEPGAIRVNPGNSIHRIENDNAEPLITLHLYSPPLIAIQK